MNDDQPTQPLTDAELVAIHDAYTKSQTIVSGIVGDPTGPYAKDCGGNAIRHVGHLLAEVDRLRAENAAVKTKCDGFQKMMNSAVSAGVTIDGERLDALREVEQLRAEATGTALGHLAKIERLQSQRDALVRKLGLDWGPDEFGDLSVVPDAEKPCLDSPDWSCRLGPRCVCSKHEHDTRHECACGSWWYAND